MQVLNANGINIHYSDSGEKDRPAIVFSNSLGTDFRSWDKVVDLIGSGFRVVRYDKRGHGLSDAPAAPYVMDDHIGDLEALMDHLDLRDTILVGLSVGGLIAQGLNQRRPDLMKAIVLCDTAARIGSLDMWSARIAAIEENGLDAVSGGILERWFTKGFRDTQPEFSAWRAMLTRTPVAGYLGTCAAIRDTDFTDRAGDIKVPVLVICGEEDGATPPALVKATAEAIPGARYREIKAAGHLPGIEQPDIFWGHIDEFLKDNGLV